MGIQPSHVNIKCSSRKEITSVGPSDKSGRGEMEIYITVNDKGSIKHALKVWCHSDGVSNVMHVYDANGNMIYRLRTEL